MLKIIQWDVVFIIINLIVLYVIMRFVMIKPIKGMIEKRESIIREGLQNAAASEANAKALEEEWNAKIKTAESHSAEMMEEARDNAKREYEKLVADAANEAESIVARAKKNMENEREKAILDLQSQIAEIAIDTTKKVLESSDLKGINDSLYEQFLTETGDGHDSDGN